jgi:hypothetical protein
MFMFFDRRLLLCGLALWGLGTAAIRLAGHRLLHPDDAGRILILFGVTFPALAWICRRLCRRFRLPRERWLAGALSLALPTLLLDAFTSAFFSDVFPNVSARAAGLFGGWMLWCCAAAVVGAAAVPAKEPA